MDEQVRGLVIGRDEAKSLVVAEPLDGSSSDCVFPPALIVLRTRRLLSKGYDRWHCDVGRITQPDAPTLATSTIDARLTPGAGSPLGVKTEAVAERPAALCSPRTATAEGGVRSMRAVALIGSSLLLSLSKAKALFRLLVGPLELA